MSDSDPDPVYGCGVMQIGQVMLTTPNSLWKTGFAVGLVWLVVVAIISLWTMYLLSAMYLERKRSMVSWLQVENRLLV